MTDIFTFPVSIMSPVTLLFRSVKNDSLPKDDPCEALKEAAMQTERKHPRGDGSHLSSKVLSSENKEQMIEGNELFSSEIGTLHQVIQQQNESAEEDEVLSVDGDAPSYVRRDSHKGPLFATTTVLALDTEGDTASGYQLYDDVTDQLRGGGTPPMMLSSSQSSHFHISSSLTGSEDRWDLLSTGDMTTISGLWSPSRSPSHSALSTPLQVFSPRNSSSQEVQFPVPTHSLSSICIDLPPLPSHSRSQSFEETSTVATTETSSLQSKTLTESSPAKMPPTPSSPLPSPLPPSDGLPMSNSKSLPHSVKVKVPEQSSSILPAPHIMSQSSYSVRSMQQVSTSQQLQTCSSPITIMSPLAQFSTSSVTTSQVSTALNESPNKSSMPLLPSQSPLESNVTPSVRLNSKQSLSLLSETRHATQTSGTLLPPHKLSQSTCPDQVQSNQMAIPDPVRSPPDSMLSPSRSWTSTVCASQESTTLAESLYTSSTSTSVSQTPPESKDTSSMRLDSKKSPSLLLEFHSAMQSSDTLTPPQTMSQFTSPVHAPTNQGLHSVHSSTHQEVSLSLSPQSLTSSASVSQESTGLSESPYKSSTSLLQSQSSLKSKATSSMTLNTRKSASLPLKSRRATRSSGTLPPPQHMVPRTAYLVQDPPNQESSSSLQAVHRPPLQVITSTSQSLTSSVSISRESMSLSQSRWASTRPSLRPSPERSALILPLNDSKGSLAPPSKAQSAGRSSCSLSRMPSMSPILESPLQSSPLSTPFQSLPTSVTSIETLTTTKTPDTASSISSMPQSPTQSQVSLLLRRDSTISHSSSLLTSPPRSRAPSPSEGYKKTLLHSRSLSQSKFQPTSSSQSRSGSPSASSQRETQSLSPTPQPTAAASPIDKSHEQLASSPEATMSQTSAPLCSRAQTPCEPSLSETLEAQSRSPAPPAWAPTRPLDDGGDSVFAAARERRGGGGRLSIVEEEQVVQSLMFTSEEATSPSGSSHSLFGVPISSSDFAADDISYSAISGICGCSPPGSNRWSSETMASESTSWEEMVIGPSSERWVPSAPPPRDHALAAHATAGDVLEVGPKQSGLGESPSEASPPPWAGDSGVVTNSAAFRKFLALLQSPSTSEDESSGREGSAASAPASAAAAAAVTRPTSHGHDFPRRVCSRPA